MKKLALPRVVAAMRQALPALLLILAACGGESPQLVKKPADVPPAIVIQDVGVLDVASGQIAPHQDVVVERDRITAVAPQGQTKPPAGAKTISAAGATLLPGLIDMHGHVGGSSAPSWKPAIPDPELNLRAYLYCGVTTVLDPATDDSGAFERRDKISSGELLGPRYYASGPMITAPGGHPVALMDRLVPWWFRWYLIPHLTRQVDTPEAARKAVDDVASHRPDVIKLSVDRIPDQVPRMQRDVVSAAADQAKKDGVRPVAHIGSLDDAVDAADAGVAMWMHGVYKERIPDDAIGKLAGYKIPMVATMAVFENYALLGQGPRQSTPLERETVDAETLAAFDQIPDSENFAFFQPYLESLRPLRPAWRDNVRRLRAAGVTILAGSDTQSGMFPGAGLHRELHLLTEAGMTPAEAIRAATLDGATFLANGKEPDFGVVAVGKKADLLLVEGDPTQDLDNLARIRAVIRDGVVLERVPIQTSRQ